MRVIIRFSIDGDDGALTTALRNILEGSGIMRTRGTATYEGVVNVNLLPTIMKEFWDKAAQGPATMDHFWMYSDKTNDDLAIE